MVGFAGVEIPMKFVKPLTDQSVMEKQPFTFTCEVTRPNVKARWLRDGQELTPADGYEITVDGLTHTLTKKEAVLEDKAKYTVIIEGKSSAANLTVSGMLPCGKCQLTSVKSLGDVLQTELFHVNP